MYIYIHIILACSRRYPSTEKFRDNDVLFTLEAVVEVQMKLRSHWKLLCKLRWQCTRQTADQGERYRRMYRTQRGSQ